MRGMLHFITLLMLTLGLFSGCKSTSDSKLKDAVLHIPGVGIIDLYIDGKDVVIRPCKKYSGLILKRENCELAEGQRVVRKPASDLRTHLKLALALPEVFALTPEYNKFNSKVTEVSQAKQRQLKAQKESLLSDLEKIEKLTSEFKEQATKSLREKIEEVNGQIASLRKQVLSSGELKDLKTNLINVRVNQIINEVVGGSKLHHFFDSLYQGKQSFMYGILVSYVGKTRKALSAPTDFSSVFSDPSKFITIIDKKKKEVSFMMGSPSSEYDRHDDEYQHKVILTKSFSMLSTEVTQGQFEKIMGYNPAEFTKNKNNPVEQVSWYEAVLFCNKLSEYFSIKPFYKITEPNYDGKKLESAKVSIIGGNGFRLPTEAEWEYAARAGTTTPFNLGENISPDKVNYDGNFPYKNAPTGIYRKETVPVGSLSNKNGFGLYDMHGNVWEWTFDWYRKDYYKNSDAKDPIGPSAGFYRVVRGGGWNSNAFFCRSANRGCWSGSRGDDDVGFRLVRTNN